MPALKYQPGGEYSLSGNGEEPVPAYFIQRNYSRASDIFPHRIASQHPATLWSYQKNFFPVIAFGYIVVL